MIDEITDHPNVTIDETRVSFSTRGSSFQTCAFSDRTRRRH
jgi:hypothetical protein